LHDFGLAKNFCLPENFVIFPRRVVEQTADEVALVVIHTHARVVVGSDRADVTKYSRAPKIKLSLRARSHIVALRREKLSENESIEENCREKI